MSGERDNVLVAIRDGWQAHASGALWKAETETAVIADLHLGYSWAQRRRGELGPLVDERTRSKLLALRDALQPKRFVFLGDIVHAPRPCTPEREWTEQLLTELAASARLVAVRGNHDRRFGQEFSHLGFETADYWSQEAFTMVHGDRWNFPWPEGHTLVVGHLHPSLGVRDASGASHKLPVFLTGQHCIVLPAFSPFARGYDVACGLPDELARCMGSKNVKAYAATGQRVVLLGQLSDALARMAEGDSSAAGQFRRRTRPSRRSKAAG